MFPQRFYECMCMLYERTLQPFLWCWQVVYSAGMVNNLSVFFFYRRQSSTINNSAVIKHFLGQWASGNYIFLFNSPQSCECLTHSHILAFINYFTEKWQTEILVWFVVRWFEVGRCSFLDRSSKNSRYTEGLLSSSLYYLLHKLYFRYQRQCVKGVL